MPCKQENVFHLLDGELSQSEANLIRKHIKSCVVCRQLLDELSPVVESLKAMSAPELQAYEALALRQQVLHGEHVPIRLAAASGSSLITGRNSARVAPWLMYVGLAGLAVAALVFAFAAGVLMKERTAGSYHEGIVAVTPSKPDGGQSSRLPSPSPESKIVSNSSGTTVPRHLAKLALSAQSNPLEANSRTIIMDRTLPSGTHVIWNYETASPVPGKM